MEYERIKGCRWTVLALVVFWALVIGGVLYSCEAKAARRVFLESEEHLDNGFKLCIYTEGVTITVAAHRLCPLSIEV